MNVTVAICTWNRASLLDQTLTALARLIVPAELSWELLVVDNNSSDDTARVIESHRSRLPLKGVTERKQGLSHARNRAVSEARGTLLLWTDDDVIVNPGWLAAYVDAADRFPSAVYFGGPVDPWFATEPPQWVSRNLDILQGPFALRALGSQTRSLAANERPFGANMAFRRSVLPESPFDPRLGRVGKEMLSGDETTVIDALREKYGAGVWVAEASVRHYVAAERLTADYVWRFFSGLGRTNQRISPVKITRSWAGSVPPWVWKKYALSRITAVALAPFKSRRWLHSHIRAASMDGLIKECLAAPRANQGR